MNRIFTFGLSIIAISGLALAIPQGYGGGQVQVISVGNPTSQAQSQRPNFIPDGCRLERKRVNDIEYREEYENKCVTKYKKEYETKYKRVCNNYQDQECKTEYERQCNTLYKDDCYTDYKTVKEPYTDNECRDVENKVCEKHWEVKGNEKLWVDDPATCKYLKETQCKDVTKYKDVKQEYRKCDKVPYEDCNNIPRKRCYPVTKERCQNQPYQVDRDVPYQDCQQVHKNVPHQVTNLQYFRVCDNKEPYQFQKNELTRMKELGILDTRTDEEFLDTRSSDEVEPTPKKKSNSAISFGK